MRRRLAGTSVDSWGSPCSHAVAPEHIGIHREDKSIRPIATQPLMDDADEQDPTGESYGGTLRLDADDRLGKHPADFPAVLTLRAERGNHRVGAVGSDREEQAAGGFCLGEQRD